MTINCIYGSSIPKDILRDTFLFYILRLLIILSVTVSGSISANGQDSFSIRKDTSAIIDSALTVDSVLIFGNEHTQDMVIRREMSLKPGSRISQEYLKYDQERIYSIGLFTQVELQVIPTSAGKANLAINVHERWYIIPFPVFGIKQGDWHKAFYGLGLIHNNFRGRNEKLYLVGVFGYDPWGSIAYRNPFLDSNGTFYYDGRISYNRVRNKSQQVLINPTDEFDEIHFTLSSSLGKRFDNYHTVWISAEYNMVDVSVYPRPTTISSSGIDRFFVFGAGYSYDTRDLAEFPGSGSLLRASVTKYGIPGHELDNVRYSLDAREYIPLTDGFVSASRFSTNLIAGGRSPGYNHVYLGYDYRIRGHYREVYEGENILGVSSEVRWTVVPPRYYRADFLPAQFGLWRFAIELAVFADAATVWFRGQPILFSEFVKGYGAGIDFLLPYSFVLRTEYALNEIRRGQFIIDLGAAF